MSASDAEVPLAELVGVEDEEAVRAAENPLPEEARRWSEQQYGEAHALRGPAAVAPWHPFFVSLLPAPLPKIVRGAAAAMGCDESYVVLPLLSALAAAIGNSRVLKLQEQWIEPAVIWTGIVGESGTLKSPALDVALRPFQQREEAAFFEHQSQLDEHERRRRRYRAELSAWKRKCRELDPRAEWPPEPAPPGARPACPSVYAADISVEALAELLLDNPRGVLVAQDELSGWLAAIDSRRGRRGSDLAHWLTMFGARPLNLKRSAGKRRRYYVPRPAVSVTGGLQPDVLKAALARGNVREGLLPRLLLAYPPVRDRPWIPRPLAPSLVAAWEDLVARLQQLEPDPGPQGRCVPRALVLSPEAREEWRVFYLNWAVARARQTGDPAAAFAKGECYGARLALVCQLVREATGEASGEAVDKTSMHAGQLMARWFTREACRIYARFNGYTHPQDCVNLLEWIQAKGGVVTTHDVMRGLREYRSLDAAEAALKALAQQNLGWIEVIRTNGRPRIEFTLNPLPR